MSADAQAIRDETLVDMMKWVIWLYTVPVSFGFVGSLSRPRDPDVITDANPSYPIPPMPPISDQN